MPTLSNLYARQILDSRATPTLETVAVLDNTFIGVASVPSGSSTGTYEAHELRDNDPTRYLGKSVFQAVKNVNETIAKSLVGSAFTSLSEIDAKLIALDPTPTKATLGANAILSVSIALAKALAASSQLPLYKYIATWAKNQSPLFIPTPLFNMINGGKHGAGNLDFQEFHVLPARKETFAQSYERGATIYLTLKKLLSRRGSIHSVGDEGGFAPNLFTNIDALQILAETITECGYQLQTDVEFSLDVAANSFYKESRYNIKDKSNPLTTEEFIRYLLEINSKYPLRLLEDALFEDDWAGWANLTTKFSPKTSIVGDDLLVTNKERVQTAIAKKSCTAAIIKPNQIGTLTQTLEVINLSRTAGWKIIASHRSGETNDTFMADFAVGIGADYVKFGAPARGERVAKYNRLLAIESQLVP